MVADSLGYTVVMQRGTACRFSGDLVKVIEIGSEVVLYARCRIGGGTEVFTSAVYTASRADWDTWAPRSTERKSQK
jgi:hypothetical protein